MLEDTNRVICICKSKKDRQYNYQKEKKTKAKNDLQRPSNTNSFKTWGELRCSGSASRSRATSDTGRVAVKRHEHHLLWKSFWTPVYVKTK